jgi:hypothetical protein
MNGNPFYVAPGNDFSGGLQGLGMIAGQMREERERKSRAEEIKSSVTQAYKSGDPEQMAQVAIQYPEAQQTLQSLYGFKNERTKQNALETYKSVLANKQNPQAALDAINERISFVESQGGDPSTVSIKARDNLQKMIQSGQDPSPFFRAAELEYAGIASPQEWQAYSATSGMDSGKIGQYNPGDYTPESFAAFTQSRNPADLKRYENSQIVDIGGVRYIVDRTTGTRTPLTTAEEVAGNIGTIKGAEKTAEESAKNIEKYKETLFDSINSNSRLVNKYKFAIKQLDNGAETGAIINKLPNLREQNVLIDVVRKEIGMEVLGSGLLGVNPTDRDVEFALTTSIPDNLRPDALKRELERRSSVLEDINAAQEEYYRLIDEEGYTKGDILRMAKQKRMQADQGGSGTGAMTQGINGQQSTGGWSIRPLGQ